MICQRGVSTIGLAYRGWIHVTRLFQKDFVCEELDVLGLQVHTFWKAALLSFAIQQLKQTARLCPMFFTERQRSLLGEA